MGVWIISTVTWANIEANGVDSRGVFLSRDWNGGRYAEFHMNSAENESIYWQLADRGAPAMPCCAA